MRLDFFDIYHKLICGAIVWEVRFTKRAQKQLKKLPKRLVEKLVFLVGEIELLGPVRGSWPNYSKLGENEHHCHLNRSYVVVWKVVDKNIQIVEVTYAGSREKAPY